MAAAASISSREASGGAAARRAQRIRRARIGEQQHAQLQARLLGLDLRVLELTRTHLLYKLRLHHVGVRRFARLLPLLGNLRESGGFVESLLSHGNFRIRSKLCVEQRSYPGHQAAARNLLLGGRLRRSRLSPAQVGHARHAECFVYNTLAMYSQGLESLETNLGKGDMVCPASPWL